MCLTSRAGSPIFESDPISSQIVAPPIDVAGDTALERKPTEIHFVRSRMLYARATLNARGLVHFGLRHIREFIPSDRQPAAKSQTYMCKML